MMDTLYSSKHNVPVSLTDISKHIIECFCCRIYSMPTQQMRVQPPLTFSGLYYRLQNISFQSTTTSTFSLLPPITTIIITLYHFFTFIQSKCTNACLRLFKQMRGQLALTSLVSTSSSKIALLSRQTEVV